MTSQNLFALALIFSLTISLSLSLSLSLCFPLTYGSECNNNPEDEFALQKLEMHTMCSGACWEQERERALCIHTE